MPRTVTDDPEDLPKFAQSRRKSGDFGPGKRSLLGRLGAWRHRPIPIAARTADRFGRCSYTQLGRPNRQYNTLSKAPSAWQ